MDLKKEVLKTCLEMLCQPTSEQETTESSSDEELERIESFVENTVASYNLKTFQKHFRINKSAVYYLIDRLERSGKIPKHSFGLPKISSEKAMLLTLWYLANMETFREISDRFDVSLSSAHRCLIRVMDFNLSLKEEYIYWPATNEEKQRNANEFQRKQNIKNVIGAIDGSHVKINRPSVNQDSYVNRKSYHSLILQGVVNSHKEFIDVYCGEPGSLHDARVLRRSALFARAGNGEFFGNYHLFGDSAHPCMTWLITPFKDNGRLSHNERNFNFKHSSTRIVVEHAFGLLKGRFGRLFHINNFDVKTCVKIIMASCILHNICLKCKDDTYILTDTQQEEICETSLNCNEPDATTLPLEELSYSLTCFLNICM